MPTVRLCAIAVLLTFVSTGNAHAYIDPGAGSLLLQVLIGSVVGGLFVVKAYWHRLKAYLGFGARQGDQETEGSASESPTKGPR